MVSVAGGMESDFSDSDCDLVSTNTYAGFKEKTSSKPESKNPTQVADSQQLSAERKQANGVVVSNGSRPGNRNTRSTESRPWHQMSSRRPCIDAKSSQLLDDLRYAITQGNMDVTKSILEKGVFVDSILKAGWTGLMYACSFGRHEIVSFLLENKADPNYHRDLFTPLMAACASSKEEDDLLKCCLHLLEYGAQVQVQERHFTTPLTFAVREGHLKIVEKLLEVGADVNACDNRKRTPLMWAAINGFGQIARLLLKNGANSQLDDTMGQTASDLAYSEGHKEIALLIDKAQSLNFAGDKKLEDLPTLSESENVNKTSIFIKPPRFSNSNQSDKSFVKHGELELFLTGIGHPELTSLFHEHKLNFHDLLVMNEEELEQIGIHKLGVRKKILEASKAVHKTEWVNSSLQNLKQQQYISCPDAVAMMANIAKHLKFISNTVTYVRQQIQVQPRILELAQDSANVHNLLDEMEESLKNVRFLNDELRFLKMHLDKVQDNVEFIPADLIVETVTIETTKRKTVKIALGITIVSFAIGAVFWKHPDILQSIRPLYLIKFPFEK